MCSNEVNWHTDCKEFIEECKTFVQPYQIPYKA